MCDHGDNVCVPAPEWSGHNGPTIAIDRCIADVVQALWAEGLTTLGSCCGHGKVAPSLVLTSDPIEETTAAALRRMDPDRSWTLYQWQLIDVSPPY